MLNITLELGDTTFVVEKEVLSKFLGIFESNEKLKTATSYKIKSNVQRQVFLMFLHAINLRLYLVQNKQRLTSSSVKKANVRKAYTLIDTEKYFDVFQQINYKFNNKSQKENQKTDKNAEIDNNKNNNENSPQKENIKLSNENRCNSSYSYYSSSSYSEESNSDEEYVSSSSSDENLNQDSDVDFDLSSDDDLDRDENDNKVRSSRTRQLNSIQRMAQELEKALFGNSESSETTITTEDLYSNQNNSNNTEFKKKIEKLDYVLFGNKHDETIEPPKINTLSRKKSDHYIIANIGVKRKPRHTFRHLPSIIFQDN